LVRAEQQLCVQTTRRAALARYESFCKLREEALFHRTLLTGLDPEANVGAARKAAAEALALFRLGPEGDAAPTRAEGLTDLEWNVALSGGYELLHVLADAEAHGSAGQGKAVGAHHTARALCLLDRGAMLLPPTHAYHVRRGRYLAELGDDA